MAPDLALWEGLLRLVLAAVLAGAIGIERELREQEAGLRTHMLVCVGATMFMLVGTYGWGDLRLGNQIGVIVDPSRVASYVVSGIGFLGAGAIIRHGINVRGLTTAASLWVVAAIGVGVGSGLYAFSIATTSLVLLALWPLGQVKRLLAGKQDATRRLRVTLESGGSVVGVLAAIETEGFGMEAVEVREEDDVRQVDVLVAASADSSLGDLLDRVAAVGGVRRVDVAE
ncbi:MAG TPA: MgtC/SapB family protein [Gaiellaceae bacterium]|nr:MgtC/SapB family protein [Gaiellaceae bacterium]